MSIEVWMAAAPAPHYGDGTIDHLLSEEGAEILRRRIRAIPAHVLHATGVTQGNYDMELGEMHAWTYSLLEDAVNETLTRGVGCELITGVECMWIVGGGMDPELGLVWSEPIAALALTGITELPLDAGPRRVAPSLKQARAIIRRPDLNDRVVRVARELMRELDCSHYRVRTVSQSVGALVGERPHVFAELMALTLRSRWISC